MSEGRDCGGHRRRKSYHCVVVETKAKVENALQLAGRVALSGDAWTSNATESFVKSLWERELQSSRLG